MDPTAGAADVGGLAGVLLDVGPLDADALARRQLEPAVDVERLVVLGDLVVLRHVRVEVVLPVEEAGLDLAVERQADPDGQLHRLPVQHRERAGQAERHGVDVGVGLVAEAVGAGAEQLGAPWPARRGPRGRRRPRSRRSARRPPPRTSARSDGSVVVTRPPPPRPRAPRPPGTSPARRAPARAPARRPAGRRPPVPNGTLMAGWPARGDGIVYTSHRYMARGLSVLAPSGKATVGVVGREQDVGVLVGPGEVVGDQPPDLQRLAVVGVVVAGRQGVRAEHDAPLHLGAEAGLTRGRVHRRGVRRRRPAGRSARRRSGRGCWTPRPAR